MATGRSWTRSELAAVLRLYCVTPFGRLHSRNPDVIALANRLNRSAGSIAYKLVNFASLDPTIDRRGMSNTSKLDRVVWSDFFENMATYLDQEELSRPRGFAEDQTPLHDWENRDGTYTLGIAKQRVNQTFFRSMILASYDSQCAMTGIADQRLLVASHIEPWAHNSALRLDPHNGICLNCLHDRAFENGLIAIAPDLSILYSPKLAESDLAKLRSVSTEKLRLPGRFRPDASLLEQHRQTRFLI